MSSLDSFLESVQLPVMPDVAHALIKTLNVDNASGAWMRNEFPAAAPFLNMAQA